jgi:polysaccharide biosynthesis transport protein
MSEKSLFEQHDSAREQPRIAVVRDGPRPVPTYGYGSSVLGSDETHLISYVKVLYKRRWTALTAFLVVLLAICVYTFTATRVYEARVQILIEKEASNVVSFKEAFEQNQLTDDYYQTQYKILQSRALARRTIDSMKLWSHPLFRDEEESSAVSTILSSPISWLWSRVSSEQPISAAQATETKAQSRTIDRFLKDLTVSPIRNSRLVDVKFESPDAALSANVANTLARGYIDQNMEFKFMSSKEASDWLQQQLSEQRKQVDVTEQALQRYREKTDAVSLEDRQNIVVQKLVELNAAVTRAKTERIQKEEAFNQIRSLQNDKNAIDTFPAILSNTFIQQQKGELAELQRQQAQLGEKLGPRHPDMIKLVSAVKTAEARIQAEVTKVVEAMRNDYLQARAQEQSLARALEQQKNDAQALNRKGIEYGVLERDAASNRQIFDSLMQRTKETGIVGELKTSNIRIVDAAETPRRPTKPNTQLNMLLALFGGGFFAIGLAFFFEYIDNRIKNPDEVKQHLGLPVLGLVPAVFEKGLANPLINNGVPANFSESFRAVRTNVLFASADEGGRSIVVTSTAPGEGKTIVAANLAIALAQAGQRVALVDADMRKPRVHSVFRKSQAPGLSNVLVGNAKASESLKQTTVPNLHILPAGVTPPDPAELLGSRRYRDFLASLTAHFDWVVIDTPPVMAVTDSSVVGHLVTGVVFVVGAEMTSRHVAQRALEQLEQARAKFIGVVLNRVDLKHNAYYYSQYYRREYTDYYAKGTGTNGRR